ncbi:hypothetical protein TNCV_455041 [Trichonephila clavipes]|nr:hypothetical protein TNCV_455041 [Trichonephila clavipes]
MGKNRAQGFRSIQVKKKPSQPFAREKFKFGLMLAVLQMIVSWVRLSPQPLSLVSLSINHWSGYPADTITTFLRGQPSFFLLVVSSAAARRGKKADEEGPRHLPNRLFKFPGMASFPPRIVFDCRTLRMCTPHPSSWSRLHWFLRQ